MIRFSSLVKKYRSKKTGSASGNLVTDLVERLGQWSSNLEAIVEERTQGYLQEKEKTENLLNEILPRPVATKVQLKRMRRFGRLTFFRSLNFQILKTLAPVLEFFRRARKISKNTKKNCITPP